MKDFLINAIGGIAIAVAYLGVLAVIGLAYR